MDKLYKKCCLVAEFVDKLKACSDDLHIYIFGAGTQGKIYARFFQEFNIEWEGFIDNNSKLWGGENI